MSEEDTAKGQDAHRHIYMLDYLMRMRQDMMGGRLAMYLGDINITRMVAFVAGYRSCQSANSILDEEYIRFRDWLRDVKHEFPTDGWDAKYLRDCDGDHERAIRKFLDFVA
ncbi:MAG TPA: hypothetical protein VEU50_22730, partial [Archangium sp.]|nr:hypothetical protein [Archangium sp.]